MLGLNNPVLKPGRKLFNDPAHKVPELDVPKPPLRAFRNLDLIHHLLATVQKPDHCLGSRRHVVMSPVRLASDRSENAKEELAVPVIGNGHSEQGSPSAAENAAYGRNRGTNVG